MQVFCVWRQFDWIYKLRPCEFMAHWTFFNTKAKQEAVIYSSLFCTHRFLPIVCMLFFFSLSLSFVWLFAPVIQSNFESILMRYPPFRIVQKACVQNISTGSTAYRLCNMNLTIWALCLVQAPIMCLLIDHWPILVWCSRAILDSHCVCVWFLHQCVCVCFF